MMQKILAVLIISCLTGGGLLSAGAQGNPDSKFLYWSPQGLEIRLQDQLRHPSFSWPLSILSYDIDFGQGVTGDQLQLIDKQSGKLVGFQLDPVENDGKVLRRARLKFLSDLHPGEIKTFILGKKIRAQGRVQKDTCRLRVERIGNEYILCNSKIKLAIPAASGTHAAPILRYGSPAKWLAHGELPASLKITSLQVAILSSGPVQAVFQLNYVFHGGKKYQVRIRLTDEMEFVELEEEMEGFTTFEAQLWRLIWDGITPSRRYIVTRAEKLHAKEKVSFKNISWEPMDGLPADNAEKHPWLVSDQRNDKHGKLPFSIAPYDNWMSWWRLPAAAFWDEQLMLTAGVFIKDTEGWDDHQYALWGSKPDLSIYFRWRNEALDFNFPLVTGKRSSAIALYNHKKDIAMVDKRGTPPIYIDDLRRWYGWIPLNKVKDWRLDYDEQETGYPRYFKASNLSRNMSILQLENTLSAQLRLVGEGTERAYGPTPVGSRIYYEAVTPAFDVFAGVMTADQYRRLRAWYLFIGYVYLDEALMPIRTMLAGHPNFLADIKGVPGMLAFLFPRHPESPLLRAHFEKSLALNLRYHVRPAVSSWETLGGRWTENLATYTWAALTPALRTADLLRQANGKNSMLQEGISDLANWLLNAVTAPLISKENRRVYPPQGAHAHSDRSSPPNALRVLAQDLAHYNPLLSEHLFWISRAGDQPFESNHEQSKPWKDILQGEWKDNLGTNPHLKSEKFTGYGAILRSGFGTAKEMYVHLQQLDEGPNYRWGRAARGGNGAIYYYAQGKRYSHNGPEDAGDGPFGDTERISNFGVKKPGGYRDIGPYRSVGPNDLTEPLYDFKFAQFACVKAAKDISAVYRSRSILQACNDYIAVYDDVPDTTTEARFSWFVGKEDEFPSIYQLRPGVSFTSAHLQPTKSSYHRDPDVMPTKGRYYDGKGSFLTVVSHRKDLTISTETYGARIELAGGRKDMVFRSGSAIAFKDKSYSFAGTAGIIQARGTSYSAAIFCGSSIGFPGITVTMAKSDSAGLSISTTSSGFAGAIQNRKPVRLVFKSKVPALKFYLNGQRVVSACTKDSTLCIDVPSGHHIWQWSTKGAVPAETEISASVLSNRSVLLKWKPVNAALHYDIEMCTGETENWRAVHKGVKTSQLMIKDLPNAHKVFFRIIAIGAGGRSGASMPYPVYPTAKKPHPPEGLLFRHTPGGAVLSWGTLLGVDKYQLYRRAIKGTDTSSFVAVYKGPRHQYIDKVQASGVIYDYFVTARNGNGESSQSSPCSTDPRSFINWQPQTNDTFRRDTENHENGFPEYNPLIETLKPILSYPLTNP